MCTPRCSKTSQGFAFEDKTQPLHADAWWGGLLSFPFLISVFSHTKMVKHSGPLLLERCLPGLCCRLVSCSAGNGTPGVQLTLNFARRCFLPAGQLVGNTCKHGR